MVGCVSGSSEPQLGQVRRCGHRSKFTVTEGYFNSATAVIADHGIARAKNNDYRKAELNLKL